mmetsp:Transcript_45513/g.73343  ORF Transcript_45513/g.73343 Transcript_45513/m.73343 type:complete len:257 (-) Transcript_45513:1137-1907(-)
MWENDYAADLFGNFQCHTTCTNRSNVYWYIQGQFQRILPDILFHTSDETCKNAAIFEQYKNFKQVFRQYACYKQYSHKYTIATNVRIIPLGYMFGMISTSSVEHAEGIMLRINNTRKYTWCFIGNLKSDRSKAIAAFANMQPNFHGQADKLQISQFYRDSNFVISPRGNVNLDCLRHYEASMNGAIPVIIGTTNEIQDTFGHFISMPPWLFEESWKAATNSVRLLMEDKDKLVLRRKSVVQWWLSEIRNSTIHSVR